MIIDYDNDGQMIFGDLGGLKLPDISLTVRKNPEKTSPRKLVPTGDRTRARYATGAHAIARPTVVDPKFRINRIHSLEIVRGDQNFTQTHRHTHRQTDTHTHTHRGLFYESCFSAKMQVQD